MKCTNCNHIFQDNEGRYNHSDGTLCNLCESNLPLLVLHKKIKTYHFSLDKYRNICIPKTEKIGKYILDSQLLLEYFRAVDQYMFSTSMSRILDIVTIQNSQDKKERILKKIFEFVNLQYTPLLDQSDSKKFLELLDKWLDEILTTKVNFL